MAKNELQLQVKDLKLQVKEEQLQHELEKRLQASAASDPSAPDTVMKLYEEINKMQGELIEQKILHRNRLKKQVQAMKFLFK